MTAGSSQALKRAAWSTVMPGLGQLLQRRPIAAAIQFSTVLLVALDASTPTLIALAIVARAFSGVEAYLNDPGLEPSESKEET